MDAVVLPGLQNSLDQPTILKQLKQQRSYFQEIVVIKLLSLICEVPSSFGYLPRPISMFQTFFTKL